MIVSFHPRVLFSSFLFRFTMFRTVNCCLCMGCTNNYLSGHQVFCFPQPKKDLTGVCTKIRLQMCTQFTTSFSWKLALAFIFPWQRERADSNWGSVGQHRGTGQLTWAANSSTKALAAHVSCPQQPEMQLVSADKCFGVSRRCHKLSLALQLPRCCWVSVSRATSFLSVELWHRDFKIKAQAQKQPLGVTAVSVLHKHIFLKISQRISDGC